ncbi:hypothetical protein R3W88_031444 [Solanum pinnatisectum]|uniref:RNase H type-1 domain-containing protein n=1 Tax=Solanum pinnatisectum TaxID=50273 RepID=A0AAV9LMN6_9SOLN|nr:hypothetical protein R3W88_031444 [Solanum pinnatisectum]
MEGQLNYNTDGASKENPGESAYGFCFRDKHGDLIYAQAKGIGIATNIKEEARAIYEALSISAKKGFQNLEIAKILEYIIREVHQQQVTIKHIYREGNQMADYLANLAIGQTEIQKYENFAELPTTGKHIINIDKAQIPTIRIKTKQIQHHASSDSEIYT